MINDRILGPVNGYYISVAALALAGVRGIGASHLGVWRVFDRDPAAHYDAGPVWDAENTEPHRSRYQALDEAMRAGWNMAMSLAPGPCRPSDSRDDLRCISYVSSAKDDLQREDLHRLVSSSKTRNAELSITGHLLMIDGRFMQYLEGPRSHVELVYFWIRQDHRHTGVIELIRECIPERACQGWTLAFEHFDDLSKLPCAPRLLKPADHRGAVQASLAYFADTLKMPRPW